MSSPGASSEVQAIDNNEPENSLTAKKRQLDPMTSSKFAPIAAKMSKICANQSLNTLESDKIVTLNIGGTVFQTAKSTLQKFDGYFKKMLETSTETSQTDEDYCIFIDRDPHHFRLILNFLRGCHVEFPDSKKKLTEIIQEAQFYELHGLVRLCLDALASSENAEKTEKPRVTGNFVKLNVGGTVFQTTKSTLIKFDGYFKTMFESDIPITKDESSGCILIDRCPDHFYEILNYLRNAHVELPETKKELKEIQNEADYYMLDGLVELCGLKIRKIDKKRTMFDESIHIIENDGQMLQVIDRSINKPVLIIHYYVDEYGKCARPKKFSISNFLNLYKHRLDVFFKSYHKDSTHENSSSVPKITHCWHWSLHLKENYAYGIPKYDATTRIVTTNESFQQQLEKSIHDFLTDIANPRGRGGAQATGYA